MIERKKQEITDFFESLLGGNVSVIVNTNCTYVEVEKSYDYVECSFPNLLKISEFFGTDQIDMRSASARGGCDTCDYGSSYTVEFTIKPKQ